jgi:ribonucleoside-triphosphate reductase
MEKEKLISLVLSALSSQTRVDVLKLLNRKETASFTEIMQSLGLNIRTEAGKFAYHLHELTNAELVAGSSHKGYSLTPLGDRVVDFIYLLEETALKRSKEMFVRTSRYSIESFNRKKITQSLVNEAGVPEEIAEGVAKEVEERLLKMKVKYLTAPLIREFVNAILIEKGMEDYRHTLTRLGLPVYDVTELIEKQPTWTYNDPDIVHSKSGDAVLEQYMLLKALPRKVSDAHLSGSIYIPNRNYWVLRPNSIQHDMRTILSGFKHRANIFSAYFSSKVRDVDSAVSRILYFLQLFNSGISGNQTLDHFNTFLSPYFDKLPPDQVSRLVRRLISGLRSISNVVADPSHSTSIVLELHTPKALRDAPAVGSSDESRGSYEEYETAAKVLFSSIIEVMIQGDEGNFPYLSPTPFIRVCPHCVSEDDILQKVHELSERWGTPFFVNEKPEWQTEAVNYDSNLIRLDSKWMGDWDLATLRTGNLDYVCINLPRIAYESKGDDSLLFEKIGDELDICRIALDAKGKVIENRMFRDNALTMLSGAPDSESYYRLRNSTRGFSYIGLPEASRFHTGSLPEDWKEVNKFSIKIIERIRTYADSLRKSTNERWVVNQAPFGSYSASLARLDIERFGREEVNLNNVGEPYYSTDNTLKKSSGFSLKEAIESEGAFHRFLNGGHTLTIPLPDARVGAERLLEVTKDIINGSELGSYSFARSMTYCLNCQTSHLGALQRCTTCGSSSTQLLNLDKLNSSQRLVENSLTSQGSRLPHGWNADFD